METRLGFSLSVLHLPLVIETLVSREVGRLVLPSKTCGQVAVYSNEGRPQLDQICGIRKMVKRIQNAVFLAPP